MSKKLLFNNKMKKRIFGSSDHIQDNPNCIHATSDAPKMGFERKFADISNPREMLGNRMKMMKPKTVFSIVREVKKSQKTINKNPDEQETNASVDFFEQLSDYAKSIGLIIGFTKLKRENIFKNHAVLFDNVIVLSMPMDGEKMNNAPSVETGKMVVDTYNELGIRANKVASFLREKGFAAQACHPLGGSIGYVPLALKAGMGWVGRHGLLITPEYGPCHRLAAVLTNISNLPVATENQHQWVGEYCDTCGRCIRTCPGKAILEKPIINTTGRKTHIEMDKCFPVFNKEYGCSVCVKECMFHRVGYQKLKENFDKKKKK